MVVYRVHLLDAEGRISGSGSLVYENDRDVLLAAATVIGHHQAIEVWDHTRVVGQLAAKDCERLRHLTARQRPNPRPSPLARRAMTG